MSNPASTEDTSSQCSYDAETEVSYAQSGVSFDPDRDCVDSDANSFELLEFYNKAYKEQSFMVAELSAEREVLLKLLTASKEESELLGRCMNEMREQYEKENRDRRESNTQQWAYIEKLGLQVKANQDNLMERFSTLENSVQEIRSQMHRIMYIHDSAFTTLGKRFPKDFTRDLRNVVKVYKKFQTAMFLQSEKRPEWPALEQSAESCSFIESSEFDELSLVPIQHNYLVPAVVNDKKKSSLMPVNLPKVVHAVVPVKPLIHLRFFQCIHKVPGFYIDFSSVPRFCFCVDDQKHVINASECSLGFSLSTCRSHEQDIMQLEYVKNSEKLVYRQELGLVSINHQADISEIDLDLHSKKCMMFLESCRKYERRWYYLMEKARKLVKVLRNEDRNTGRLKCDAEHQPVKQARSYWSNVYLYLTHSKQTEIPCTIKNEIIYGGPLYVMFFIIPLVVYPEKVFKILHVNLGLNLDYAGQFVVPVFQYANNNVMCLVLSAILEFILSWLSYLWGYFCKILDDFMESMFGKNIVPFLA